MFIFVWPGTVSEFIIEEGRKAVPRPCYHIAACRDGSINSWILC